MEGDVFAPPVAPSEPTQTKKCNCWKCDANSGSFGKKILYTLMGVLLVYLIVLVGTMMRNNMRQYYYIGQAPTMERTISVSGYGKMNGVNDIAMTTIGFTNTDKDVAKAQADNKKIMDQVIADLKKMGVADKDLESNYSIYPQYDYTQSGSQFKGYQVTNNVTVKIRELAKISDVLGLAGKYGANSVNGLSFTMDDSQALKDQARAKAVADAKAKATKLAQSLGVQLVELISYNDYEGGGTPYPMANNYGMGGAAVDAKMVAPSVETGSQDVIMNVNLTYRVVPMGG